MNLPEHLFWDTDYSAIDWDEKARYVISRVLMYGSLADWKAVLNYYGKERVYQEMLESKELDPKSLSYLSCLFNTPPEKFACYTRIQSSQAHWTY